MLSKREISSFLKPLMMCCIQAFTLKKAILFMLQANMVLYSQTFTTPTGEQNIFKRGVCCFKKRHLARILFKYFCYNPTTR
jgi:hypothetical protein